MQSRLHVPGVPSSLAEPLTLSWSVLHAVFHRTEEAVLPDRQDVSHPDQSDDPTTPGSCHQGYASLQES